MAEGRFAFGLHFRSELELPELAPGGVGEPDVTVRLGDVPHQLDGAAKAGRRGWATPDAFLFEAPGVARYLASGGAEVVVEPCVGAAASHVRTFLLGSVLGALCYQRGLIPLHANAMETDGRAVAIAGSSGAGKSTLAAHLSRRGYRVMGDDVCALSFEADGRVMVWPGARRFKLWADALAAFGEDTAGLQRVADRRAKYVLPHERDDAPTPAPLDRIYLLAKAAPGEAGAVRPLGGKAAFEALLANTYRLEIATAMGRRAEVFARSIETLRQASVFVFERRWGLDRLAEEAALLEAHFKAPSPAGGG
ncbi:MAG TPA: hypothetical protein VN814_08815 [Caulobacteraceae bacterium]|nr:hypothetical protein [Caulobacteraceae bacterium]